MFDENKLYFLNDPALSILGVYSTLAGWRHKGFGPKYIKIGSRVAYKGCDLNAWIEARTVQPAA